MNQDRPDNVVFNEESQVYDASLKEYATNVGAPVISTIDTIAWKNRNLQVVNAQFRTKYNELKSALDNFKENFEYNQLVYNSKFSFEPLVGESYHLYQNSRGENFLSILSPQECSFNFVGSFILSSDKTWIKIS